MLKRISRWQVLAGILVWAAGGFFLRKLQLDAFTAEGLPGGGTWHLVIMSVAALAFAALSVFSAELKDPLPAGAAEKVLSLLAAGFLAAGSFALLQGSAAGPFVTPTAVLGGLSALCFATAPFCGKRKPAALWLLPIAYYILQLIFSFKRWSTDPIILDYCFRLFALIFTMLGAYFFGGFTFGTGNRRLSLFFALGGIFFSAVALADGGTVHLLQTAGGLLYLAANACGLMRK